MVGASQTLPVPRYTFTRPSPLMAEPISDFAERSTVNCSEAERRTAKFPSTRNVSFCSSMMSISQDGTGHSKTTKPVPEREIWKRPSPTSKGGGNTPLHNRFNRYASLCTVKHPFIHNDFFFVQLKNQKMIERRLQDQHTTAAVFRLCGCFSGDCTGEQASQRIAGGDTGNHFQGPRK